MQEGVSSIMGAPLILTRNRHNSPETSNNMAQEEQQLQKENSTEKEDEKSVNGKLDININENSVHNASEINTTEYHQLIDFKHNYH